MRRIQVNNSDRRKFLERLYHCIDPLDPAGHSALLFNIVSVKLTAGCVNVQNSLQIGESFMEAYENKLHQSVYDKISSPIDTMDRPRRRNNMGTATPVDTEVIPNRTLGTIV